VQVTLGKRKRELQVLADDTGTASRAGSALLRELADRLGLTALSAAMAGTRARRSAHDAGRALADLALMLAEGNDCLADWARSATRRTSSGMSPRTRPPGV
jgi:hypothetical protein